jgi:hypothetical protein
MKNKLKNALLFGMFIFINSVIVTLFTEKNFYSREFILNIISASVVAVAFGYTFGFILKGSFGWKHKKEDIRE